ncbi:MYND finger [Diplogelasinospora grovesii]|uniref:MYND finger n=1 Tax=Diplogelasinospora grovesii TaxID=303347 RepID=A0AAN6MY98_9PEZI|nr:MYND finger [Diplogelasinospora grovesii]
MLTPTIQAVIRPFYAIGNTPAISLTRCLPQGLDADILQLGCGDVRHILFTAYAEQGFPSRKLDITCCDIQDHVLARNILMLSLLLNTDEEAVPSDKAWNIYYHRYLDDADMELLAAQAKKLLAVSKSLDDWHASMYGLKLRFCDSDTFSAVRAIWKEYADAVQEKDTAKYKEAFEKVMQKSREFKKKAWGEFSMVHTSSRSGAPVSLFMMEAMMNANEQDWQTGLSGGRPSGQLFPNPMFAVAVSGNSPLAYPSSPLLSFHLATAYANLTELSPLRPESEREVSPEGNLTSVVRVAEAARLQFREWTKAFGEAVSRMTIRFTSANCFALCHTLQHCLETGEPCANWYRREVGMRPLVLEESDYGKGGDAPKQFDVIDTSNISDYDGALNLLVSAGPLLKDRPAATLYTEFMKRGATSENNKFEELLCGHTKTASLLLGLGPIEYWTNATAYSIVDECLMAMPEKARSNTKGPLKVQARIAWKHNRFISGTAVEQATLAIKPEDLATAAHSIYLQMNDQAKHDIPMYHQGSFVAFLKAVCRKAQTNPAEVGRLVMEKVRSSEGAKAGPSQLIRRFRHALSLEVSQVGLYTEPSLSTTKSNNTDAAFCKWTKIPEAVAVTLAISPRSWKPFHTYAVMTGAPLIFEAHLRTAGSVANVYSDVQIGFGSVATRGSKDQDEYMVLVNEADPWAEGADMIAAFYAPAAVLQTDWSTAQVTLGLLANATSMAIFGQMLGSSMTVFGAKLHEEQVYISKQTPGQKDYHIVGGSLPTSPGFQDLAITPPPCPTPRFTADVEASSGDINCITGHVDIAEAEGKQLLADKAPIELCQSSPFAIDIVMGKRPQSLVIALTFPVPVSKEGSKTRIARKSSYIEIMAPLAHPLNAGGVLDDYLFPSTLTKPGRIPATLNTPHLSLDTLPILSVEDKDSNRFMTTLYSSIFSSRERALREKFQADPTRKHGLSPLARLNFKESLFTILVVSAGIQGGQTGLFAIAQPGGSGVHMLLFVSAIRIDGANASIVLDAAIIAFTHEMLMTSDEEFREFLLLVRTLECCTVTVDDAELVLWKKMLPSLAERCRTWEHGPDCEYAKKGANIPLSTGEGEQVLCSCGAGKLPDKFVTLPYWEETASKYATRVAISPTYSSMLAEEIIGIEQMARYGGGVGVGEGVAVAKGVKWKDSETCRNCGKTEAPGGGQLKKCMRCLKAKYCSGECQKKDWKKHRGECGEAEEYHK